MRRLLTTPSLPPAPSVENDASAVVDRVRQNPVMAIVLTATLSLGCGPIPQEVKDEAGTTDNGSGSSGTTTSAPPDAVDTTAGSHADSGITTVDASSGQASSGGFTSLDTGMVATDTGSGTGGGSDTALDSSGTGEVCMDNPDLACDPTNPDTPNCACTECIVNARTCCKQKTDCIYGTGCAQDIDCYEEGQGPGCDNGTPATNELFTCLSDDGYDCFAVCQAIPKDTGPIVDMIY